MTIIGYFIGLPAWMQGITKTPFDAGERHQREIQNQIETAGCKGTAAEIGDDSSSNSIASGQILANNMTGLTTGDCYSKIIIHIGDPNGQEMRVAMYETNALVAESVSQVLTLGANTFPIPFTTLTQDNIKLAFQIKADSAEVNGTLSAGKGFFQTGFSYGPFPDPFVPGVATGKICHFEIKGS